MLNYTKKTIHGRTTYVLNGIEYTDASLFFHLLIRDAEARGIKVPREIVSSFLSACADREYSKREGEIARAELNGM